MSFLRKSSNIISFLVVVLISSSVAFSQIDYGQIDYARTESGQSEYVHEVPFMYPDPHTIGVHPHVIYPHQPGPVTDDRYAGISEQERRDRMMHDYCAECNDLMIAEQPACPLCEEDYHTPCGKCAMCLAGFPCEKTLCRHCIQPRSKNMGNACDLTAGDEPCGTCDACREHRSDPCEHADDGWGPRGEFNPYHEPRLYSVIPRPILDEYNNGARKFPVYYNPAPYYRPTWNPSLYAGYARPYTFRWSCPLCFKNPCECNTPPLAGQVPYAYTCKFCGRNPCACTQDICAVNEPMDPKGITDALTIERESAASRLAVPINSETEPIPAQEGDNSISVEGLLNEPTAPSTPPTRTRPSLDTPPPSGTPSESGNNLS